MGREIQITETESFLLDIPLKRPHVMSFGSPKEVNFVLVKLTTNRGITGWGEASTFQGPTWSEESAETIKTVIDRYLFPLIEGKNPLRFQPLLHEMNLRIKGNSFAKAAVELAILDLFGKSFNQPVYALFGGGFRDRVSLSWSLASGGVEQDVAEAREMVAKGVRIFKIKAGSGPVENDVEKVRGLRKGFSDSIRLRVDINQGWNYQTALRGIKALEAFDLDFIEQPLPKGDLEGLSELRKRTSIPLMVDESLGDMVSALTIIKLRAADIFSYKLTKAGGFLPARNLYAIARAADIAGYIGCMIETSLGTAAYLHFAALMESIEYGCELFGPLLLQEDIVHNPIRFKEGYVHIPSGPGWGVEIDERKIESYRRQ